MAVLIKIRRDTSANWSAYNPVLAVGEPAYVTDTHQLAFGDGMTPFTSLNKFDTLDKLDLSAYALQSSVQGGYDALQGQITTQQTQQDAIYAQQQADNAHLTSIDNQLTQFNTFTTSQNNYNSNFDSQLLGHSGQLAAHDASLNNFVTNFNNIGGRLDLHDIDISALQSQVSQLQSGGIGEIDGGGAAG